MDKPATGRLYFNVFLGRPFLIVHEQDDWLFVLSEARWGYFNIYNRNQPKSGWIMAHETDWSGEEWTKLG